MKEPDLVSAQPRPAAAVYTLRETAALLGCSYGSLWTMVQENRAPVTPLKIGRKWLFPRARVNALLGIDPERATA